MNPIAKFLLGLVLFAVLVVAIPFGIDWGLRAWDTAYDPYTAAQAVHMESGRARSGMNRRVFCEERFRSHGMMVKVFSTGLDADALEAYGEGAKGRISVYKLESAEDAVIGPHAPASATQLVSFAFRLSPVRSKRNLSDAAETDAFGLELPSAATIANSKFDLECVLVPLTTEDEKGAREFAALEYAQSAPYEFDIELEGDVPASAVFDFSYSKVPRSLLHGMFGTDASKHPDELLAPELDSLGKLPEGLEKQLGN